MKPTILIALSLFSLFSNAQDPGFTQIQNVQSYVNPAMVGNDSADMFSLKYRDQWPTLPGDFKTFTTEYDHYHVKTNGVSYLRYTHDRAGHGVLIKNDLALGYSQKFKIFESMLIQIGGELAYFKRKLDWSSLTFGDPIDPRRGFIYQTGVEERGSTRSGIDISAGALVSYRKVFIGFSTYHINEPTQSVISYNGKLPARYSGQFGFTVETKAITLKPYALGEWQAGFNRYQMGLNTIFSTGIALGFGYQPNNAIIGQFGYCSDVLTVLYDLNVFHNDMLNFSAHEISASVRLFRKSPHPKLVLY